MSAFGYEGLLPHVLPYLSQGEEVLPRDLLLGAEPLGVSTLKAITPQPQWARVIKVGILGVTDRRVLFLAYAMGLDDVRGGRPPRVAESWSYKNMTSVEIAVRSRLLLGGGKYVPELALGISGGGRVVFQTGRQVAQTVKRTWGFARIPDLIEPFLDREEGARHGFLPAD